MAQGHWPAYAAGVGAGGSSEALARAPQSQLAFLADTQRYLCGCSQVRGSARAPSGGGGGGGGAVSVGMGAARAGLVVGTTPAPRPPRPRARSARSSRC